MVFTRLFIPTGYRAIDNGLRFNLEYEISSTISWINLDSTVIHITFKKKKKRVRPENRNMKTNHI